MDLTCSTSSATKPNHFCSEVELTVFIVIPMMMVPCFQTWIFFNKRWIICHLQSFTKRSLKVIFLLSRKNYPVIIGGHLVRYPWSAISDWAWYRNIRYWTERAEFDIISDMEECFILYPISYIPDTTKKYHRWEVRHLATVLRNVGLNPVDVIILFL
jgi:hypothetical protein